jgi:hypothetical protein
MFLVGAVRDDEAETEYLWESVLLLLSIEHFLSSSNLGNN